MKVQPSGAEGFVASVPACNALGVLLYGDAGVVGARESAIRKALSGRECMSLSLDTGDNSCLLELRNGYLAPSFFSGERFVAITDVKSSAQGGLVEILQEVEDMDGLGHCREDGSAEVFTLCVFRENLEAKNPIRRFFESSKGFACVPCYADTPAQLADIASSFAKENELVISGPNLRIIAAMFSSNRAEMLSELQKLAMYKYSDESKEVTAADIGTVLSERHNEGMFDAVNAFFGLQFEKFELIITNSPDMKGRAAGLVFSIVAHALQLKQYLFEASGSKSVDDVLSQNRVFFKRIPLVKRELSIWANSTLDALLARLAFVDYMSKTSHEEFSFEFVKNLLYTICLRLCP